MRIDIHDLFDSWEEQELTLEPKRPAAVKEITRRTMSRLEQKPRRQRHVVRRIGLAAAACLVLAGSVFAVARYQALKVAHVSGYEGYADGEGPVYMDEADTTLNVTPQEDAPETAESHILGLRASDLPDPLSEIDSSSLRQQLEWLQSETGEDLLSAYPQDDQVLDTAYTHICTLSEGDPGDRRIIDVTIYDAGQFADKTFIMAGSNLSAQEGTLCGMEAVWLTQAFDEKEVYHIVLYNEEMNCVIHIGGSSKQGDVDFALLEQIAEGLEIVDTGIPSNDLSQAWSWTMLSAARG